MHSLYPSVMNSMSMFGSFHKQERMPYMLSSQITPPEHPEDRVRTDPDRIPVGRGPTTGTGSDRLFKTPDGKWHGLAGIMWQCQSCNKLLDCFSDSCSRCGTPNPKPLSGGPAQETQDVPSTSSAMEMDPPEPGWTCMNCDAAQPEGNKFCGGCGASRGGEGGAEQCVVCMDARSEILLKHEGQEGHMCVCKACAELLKANGDPCPMCREPILEFIRAF